MHEKWKKFGYLPLQHVCVVIGCYGGIELLFRSINLKIIRNIYIYIYIYETTHLLWMNPFRQTICTVNNMLTNDQ